MRRPLPILSAAVAVAACAVLSLAPGGAAAAESAPVQDYLAERLSSLSSLSKETVLVHGASLTAARDAVAASGLDEVTSFDKIGVVVARGTKAEIRSVTTQPGVTYVEGNQPIELAQFTSNKATRGEEALATVTGADGARLDGRGVSVAVIDSGVDPTHPYLKNADGTSAVVSNQKVVCDLTETLCQVLKVPNLVDTDVLAVGGHGTHVAGIVAGRETTLSDGRQLHGAAPGASIVSISTGAVLFIIGADQALNWVLENHEAPCGAGVPASTCPPIKVTNNSYGPSGGGDFDSNSATVKLQRALAAEGVVTAWANGNDGGDGSQSLSNPPGMDPTGGIISVASYHDLETGTRDGEVSEFSSRGRAGDTSTYPDISAPGDTITSSCRIYLPICTTGGDVIEAGNYNTISGTSMATPHIAGIVAQLFQKSPSASPGQVEQALKSTAHRYSYGAPYESGPGGLLTSYDKGTGLVDVVAAAHALP
ncbi:MAG: S8 family serine peptidase [Nocardioides sp.]